MAATGLTRRDFVKGVGVAGALAAGGWKVFDWQPVAASRTELPQLIPTVCGMCDVQCGAIAYVKDGKLLKMEGNYNHTHSLGRICGRGSAAVKLLYDPDRLKWPLKRVAPGKFERISWDQAWKEIAAKLQEVKAVYGPQALAWARRPQPTDLWDQQFMKAFGSPNLFGDAAIGYASRDLACQLTVGRVPFSDLRNSRFIISFGRNFAESIFVSDLQALMEAKEKGAKIVVVDPRLSNTAAKATEWVPIRPGTDGALILAMMHVIVKDRLYDAGFVDKYVVGFSELSDYVSDKTPAWAASVCDIPADTIERLARDFAAAKPNCCVDPGWHSAWGAHYTNSVQTARAALTLNALVGSYGANGGLLFSAEPPYSTFQPPVTPPTTTPRADGAGTRLPLAPTDGILQELPDIILSGNPYPIRALIVNHMNVAHNLPQPAKFKDAAEKLDLLVAIDVQMSETAELAHYVLPESTFLERYDPIANSNRGITEIALRQPVVKPMYDTKPAYDIITGLALAAGLGRHFSFSIRDVIEATTVPLGLGWADLLKQGLWRDDRGAMYRPPVFATPSGKVEVYSRRLKDAGFNPLPAFEPPMVSPPKGDFFRLLHGRDAVHTGTSTQNNAYLSSLKPENELWVNRSRAARLGVNDGDWVMVKSEAGEVKARARVTEGIHPEAVYLAHGFGHTVKAQRHSYQKGVNDSALIVKRTDPISAAANLNETIVQVRRAS